MPSAPSSTLTLRSSMPLQCGSFICRIVRILVLPSRSVLLLMLARFWPGNGRKWFLYKISTFLMVLKGVGSMEVFLLISMRVCTFSMEVIQMVLKGGWLYAVGTLGHWLAFRPGMRRLTLALTSSGCATGLSVPGSWLFRPTTCTEMIFIATLVTFLAPCWAFSWWVRLLHLPHVLPWLPLALWPWPFLCLKVLILSMVVAIATIGLLDCCHWTCVGWSP